MNQLATSEYNPKRPFVPVEFEIPQQLETSTFRLRMLSVDDVDKDYEAVVSSAAQLRSMFEQWRGWPREGFTIEENLEDLRQHQQEFENRKAFAYTVVSLDESSVLGCVYISPKSDRPLDAEVLMWVRESEYKKGLDSILFQTVKKWIEDRWTFEKVTYTGRSTAES
jgi:RimJ/RimL family protein N-acetyltransferase